MIVVYATKLAERKEQSTYFNKRIASYGIYQRFSNATQDILKVNLFPRPIIIHW
jgi:hypothetical protein